MPTLPLGTFWLPWTTRYPLLSLDHYVSFANLGIQGLVCQHLTERYPLPTLDHWVIILLTFDHYVPFANIGPLGTLCLALTTRYPLKTLEYGTLCIHLTDRYHFPTSDRCFAKPLTVLSNTCATVHEKKEGNLYF